MLTDTKCKAAKPENKPYKISDSHGLYLLVNPKGGKYWRMKYRFHGKEKMLCLGVYPHMSLAEAREGTTLARKQLAKGIDPSLAKQLEKQGRIRNAANTFKVVAMEWHENQAPSWSEKHRDNVLHKLQTDLLPYIGSRPIADIEAPELLDILKKIEKRGAIDMMHRARGICSMVFRYGIVTGRCKHDPAADLKGALKTQKTQHFAALPIHEMPKFLQALENNDARLYPRTRRAIKLLMLTFVRTRELIEATWDEFDFEAKNWIIPEERMKMRKSHIVPLSRQAIELLKEQKEETGHFKTNLVFPSQIRPSKSMSNNTILFAIKRLGYQGHMTGHGFRALARTTIREKLDYDTEVIERQLAHGPSGSLKGAYDRTQFLDKRTIMMQDWADYVDAVASQGKVILGKFK